MVSITGHTRNTWGYTGKKGGFGRKGYAACTGGYGERAGAPYPYSLGPALVEGYHLPEVLEYVEHNHRTST